MARKIFISIMISLVIDEYRLTVAPVILGRGNSRFRGLPQKMNMPLLKSQAFQSNVLLRYKPCHT